MPKQQPPVRYGPYEPAANGNSRHHLLLPYIRIGDGKQAVHESGVAVVCSRCRRTFILLEASDYAKILARAGASDRGLP